MPAGRRRVNHNHRGSADAATLVVNYFGYHNWRSKRAWRTFQTSLSQSEESLNLLALLPERAPDDANFARSPAFLGLLSKTNRESTGSLERMRSFVSSSGSAGNSILMGERSFILRGVGPNGTDDRKNNPSDDWLWSYSTNTPSAKQ